MEAETKKRIGADEFLAWSREQAGRYELICGEVVQMAPQRVAHVRSKAAVWRALSDGLARAQLDCEALTDGASVRVDDATVYEPDALVHCQPDLAADAIVVPRPIIVVEVLSPSTAARDVGAKLEDYFRLPSVEHYLLFRTERPSLIHHRRLPDGIATAIHQGGPLELDPPGFTLELGAIFGASASPSSDDDQQH